MAIAEHPLAKELPTTTDTLSIQSGADKFQQFAVSKDAPAKLEDYLKQNIPMLSLYVTSFRDATLVGLSWPHALMDVMGQQALLHAWSLVLAGRISDVPPVLGAHEDVIRATLDDSPKGEDFIMGQRQLKGWSMVKFGLNYAWDLLRGPAPEVHSIFLPQRVMAEMRRRAEDDLAVDEASVNEKHFISDGDILTAWATQAVARSLPKSRPVTVFQVLNARFRLPSLIQASGVYIQNMVVAGFTLLSPQAASGPLGHIALENRRCLREQATEGQVLALLRQLRQQLNKSKDPNILCGETDAVLLCVSNWGRADMFKAADFGPAVIRAGKQGAQRSNPPGTIVYHHAGSMRRLVGLGNLFLVLGKDHGGNYWLSGTLPPSTWEAIKENTII
ncbi:hypothetical protein IL306_011610 [Fusarium sp. DS 682]|nr:hypothetical protein IL306_011610 [Fusarium sp. DS 682]